METELCTPPSTLEAQVVIWADKIAYITHDFEDFYKTELYSESIKNNKKLKNTIEKILKKITGKSRKKFQTRDLVRSFTKSLIKQSFKNFKESNLKNGKKVKTKTYKNIMKKEESLAISMSGYKENKLKRHAFLNGQIVNMKKNTLKGYFKLRSIVDQYYIGNHKIKKSDIKGSKIIESLFYDLMKHPDLLPNDYKAKQNDEVEKRKIVAYYISTMSDDYARKLYLHLNSLIDNFEI